MVRSDNPRAKGYLAKDGRLVCPFQIAHPNFDDGVDGPNEWAHVHLAITRNGGKTWEIPKLDPPLAIASPCGGIVKLKDGTLLLALWGTAKLEEGLHKLYAGVLRSVDDGKTWSDYTIIGEHASSDGGPARIDETSIVELPSGKLLSMSRPTMLKGVSLDKGRTWKVGPSTLTRKGTSGLCPSMCYSEAGPPEGIVVLTYHDRWGEHANKGGMYIAFSYDEGQSWGEPMWFSGGAYPCVIETEPGQMFCTYYRSPALLKGVFFGVPFPTGLLTQSAGSNSLKLKWDLYKGKKAKDYSYHIYRATDSDVKLTEENRIGIVKQANSFNDKSLKQDKVYYYRVVARDGKNQVGVSWLAASRTSSVSQ